MQQQAPAAETPLPQGLTIPPGTLRAEMMARRAAGGAFELREAVAIIVPVCSQLAELHGAGQRLFLHPSSITYLGSPPRAEVVPDSALEPPVLPRDHACLAPECRKGEGGDARSSVFAIGALAYELLTGASVGPGMRRPRDVVPELPEVLEAVLGKALVADPKHRPADLAALAQAFYHIAPSASEAPPPADESHLDHDEGFDVDVSLSMIPPAPSSAAGAIPRAPATPRFDSIEGSGPFAVAIPRPAAIAGSPLDPTMKLAELKAALESDPRPRYVVVKDGMDHGPFSAVELLQQLASGTFHGDNILRDAISKDERPIEEWDEFAPFAQHAKLNRDIKEEKRAFEAVVVAEKKGTQTKALVGAAVLGILGAGAAGFWYRERQNQEREIAVQSDEAVAIEVDGGLGKAKGAGGPRGGGGPRPAGGGSFPVLGGGMSCEGAQARYVEEYKMGNNGPADLTAGQYGNVLNKGSYLNSCGVPSNMTVNVCAAVQNGRAVGVSVSTSPSNPGISSCISGQIRSMSFPSHPRLDVARTTFAGN